MIDVDALKSEFSDDKRFCDFLDKISQPDWRETARIGMMVYRLFESLDNGEVLFADENEKTSMAFVNALEAKFESFLANAEESPCCQDRSPAHTLRVVGQSAMLWAFMAGARSGNLNIPGLVHDPLPLVSDEDIEEEKARFVNAQREERVKAKEVVMKTISDLGLQFQEKDGVGGVVVQSREQLEELMSRLKSHAEVVEIRKKEETEPPSTGLYL